MKLCSGKRRQSRSLCWRFRLAGVLAVASVIRKEASSLHVPSTAVFLRCFTRRTASRAPQTWVKFAKLRFFKPRALGCMTGGYLSGLVQRDNFLLPSTSPSRVDRRCLRPVLKHGPRSLTCARVIGLYETQRRSESEGLFGRSRWDPVF